MKHGLTQMNSICVSSVPICGYFFHRSREVVVDHFLVDAYKTVIRNGRPDFALKPLHFPTKNAVARNREFRDYTSRFCLFVIVLAVE